MDDGAQRVESSFDRARVREETGPGGAVLSSGSASIVTDAQTVKRKAEDTDETDARTKKIQTAVTPVPEDASRRIWQLREPRTQCHSSKQTDQRVVVPPEVPQDKRSSIEDMDIGQLRVKDERS